MEGPNGERHDNTGCFLAVEHERLLVFTDALGPGYRPAGGGFMTASVTLEPYDRGEALHRRWRCTRTRRRSRQHEAMGFHQGWGTALDQLVALVKGL